MKTLLVCLCILLPCILYAKEFSIISRKYHVPPVFKVTFQLQSEDAFFVDF